MKDDTELKGNRIRASGFSRADALRTGVLVDVSELAREAGYDIPVAVTRRVWDDWIQSTESAGGQGASEKMRNILSALWGKTMGNSTQYNLQVLLAVGGGRAALADLAAFFEPDGTSEAVLTIMRLDEV